MAGPDIAPAGASYPRIDVDDVQGIAIRGYGQLQNATFFVFAIRDAAGARQWLAQAVSPDPERRGQSLVTSARPRSHDRAVNIAFTRAGLERLGLDANTIALFSREFLEGMVTETRKTVLGDLGADDPEHWNWGQSDAHLDGVLMVFAHEARVMRETLAEFSRSFDKVYEIPTFLRKESREHFGFRDGLSQPHVRHDNPPGEVSGVMQSGPDANAVNAGEFLLGYFDEFGCRQPSPLVPANADKTRTLLRGEDGFADFGRNGSYLVVRQLEQKVFAFWDYMRSQSDSSARDARSLAAKIVGRWPDGAPLALHPHYDPGAGYAYDNDFGYALSDRAGMRCPVGAHVRRANPRDSVEKGSSGLPSLPEAFDRPTRVANRHRLIRRGRSYGPFVEDHVLEQLQTTGAEDDGEKRGLVFAAFVASIRRQFEFVQTTWCNNPDFQGLTSEPDPLIGAQLPHGTASFTVQGDVPLRLREVPPFIRVRGGAYFFMPSLRALRYLAKEAR